MRLGWVAALVLMKAGSVWAGGALDKAALRKTTQEDLTPRYERLVLPNGLTVLLSPDRTVPCVVIDQSFFAGALFEPAGKSGLAHLVEHLMSSGAGDADYDRMLTARGATGFNAFTSIDLMTFHVVVPPEELPLALWVATDRLGTLAARIDDAELERNRRIIVEERAVRVDDVAYAAASQELYGRMFPAPHPLHGMVIGVPSELGSATVSDVRAFADRYLVPANGILTMTGNFDPAVAREWLDKTLGRLPGGARASSPAPSGARPPELTLSIAEPRSRRPRVTFAWRFGALPIDVIDALEFGAQLLMMYTDGALGMQVRAGFEQFLGGSLFRFDVTMAHEKSKRDGRDEAEALLRYLTRATSTDDVFSAALLAWDRAVMTALDDAAARSAMLTQLEYVAGDPASIARYNERHWALLPWDIAPRVRKVLDEGRFTLHSRPTFPRPRRAPRD